LYLVVTVPAADDRNILPLLRQGKSDLADHLGNGGEVREEILVNKPDAHVLALYPLDHRTAQDEDIHLRPKETVERLLRPIYDRLVLVEGCVEDNRDSSPFPEFPDQPVIKWILRFCHGLEATGAVDVSHGGDQGSFFRTNPKHLLHEGDIGVVSKYSLPLHGECKARRAGKTPSA
jgi:hypothetical protein